MSITNLSPSLTSTSVKSTTDTAVLEASSCWNTVSRWQNVREYMMGSSDVANSSIEPHGLQQAVCTCPEAMVQRSGVHWAVSHTLLHTMRYNVPTICHKARQKNIRRRLTWIWCQSWQQIPWSHLETMWPKTDLHHPHVSRPQTFPLPHPKHTWQYQQQKLWAECHPVGSMWRLWQVSGVAAVARLHNLWKVWSQLSLGPPATQIHLHRNLLPAQMQTLAWWVTIKILM